MMKTILALMVLTISVPAFAKLEEGDYRGTDTDGNECGFEIKKVSYVDDERHPLNERVEIVVDGVNVVLAHPQTIDMEQGTVEIDHDKFIGAIGVEGGIVAANLAIEHEEKEASETPTSLTLLRIDENDSSNNVTLVCEQLEYKDRRGRRDER
jgi:hypothetical protein